MSTVYVSRDQAIAEAEMKKPGQLLADEGNGHVFGLYRASFISNITLLPKAGRCVNCKKRQKRNRLKTLRLHSLQICGK